MTTDKTFDKSSLCASSLSSSNHRRVSRHSLEPLPPQSRRKPSFLPSTRTRSTCLTRSYERKLARSWTISSPRTGRRSFVNRSKGTECPNFQKSLRPLPRIRSNRLQLLHKLYLLIRPRYRRRRNGIRKRSLRRGKERGKGKKRESHRRTRTKTSRCQIRTMYSPSVRRGLVKRNICGISWRGRSRRNRGFGRGTNRFLMEDGKS